MNKLHLGISSALAVAGATGFALQARSNAALGDEVAALRQQNAALTAARAENTALARTVAEIAEMKGDDAALARLNDEATALKARAQQLARAEQAATSRAAQVDTTNWDRMPSPKNQTRPEYPAELREAGITGEVVVNFVVDADGNVQNARAVKVALNGQTMEMTDGATQPRVRLVPFTVAATSEQAGAGAGAKLNGADAVRSAQLLEAAAIAAVSRWKFDAGTKGGRAVNTSMQTPIVFTLSDGSGAGVAQPKTGP